VEANTTQNLDPSLTAEV